MNTEESDFRRNLSMVRRSGLVSRGRLVGRGRLVSRGRVVLGGGFVRRFVVIVFGLSAVGNVSNITAVSIDGVFHGLGTAIRQQNVVRSMSGISISVLILTVVKTSIVILDGISVVVGGVSIFVFGFMVGWGRFVGGGRLVGWGRAISQGNSGQAKNDKNLQRNEMFGYFCNSHFGK